ncbi:FMN-dependent dehydrogenase-domain-containing protein [Stachybotrys elegans]|uniref:L-lactate dehydrogenase (cytochrome) n=1 Tax=Stachybotrys elegans TaxID=80388 RepID=A0A8K0SVE1_9HYPO|nr:FMN-dependent dehydrogenase-domain-containing protein [Stachybotrys elegans]
MTRWLQARCPTASQELQLACRAQHFRRWEIPRSSFPMTRPGYLTWRSKQKSQAAARISELLAASSIQPAIPASSRERVAALIRKENLGADPETQVLEDVACLVFLDDQFDDFEKKPDIDEDKIIGILRKTWGKMTDEGREIALKMELGDRAKILSSLLSTHDFELVASRTLTPKAWAFVSSAATDTYTKQRNDAMYSAITLRPRILRDVAATDMSTAILGHDMRMPIFCSPTAMAGLVHPDGERAIGRACKVAGIAQCVSTSASVPLADVVAAIDNHPSPEPPFQVPVFFQLYINRDREASRKLLQAALQCGIKALFVTVDAPIPGKREADERVQTGETYTSPLSGASASDVDTKGGGIGRIMGNYIDASVTWEDIPWLRSCVPGLPIVLKGVQTCEDAMMARDAGVDGIVISNHGGRSLDTAPSTILVLLEIHRNCPDIFTSLDVLIDGGITRGTDIFKALCLGAKAVGIGRGCLYALNYGYQGVLKYIGILRDELETTMKMCGVTRLDQLHPGYLNTLAVDHLIPQCIPLATCMMGIY